MKSVRIAATLLLILGLLQISAPTAGADDFDVYTTEGTHYLNGREWRTTCEPYSQTKRCRTEIKATTVSQVNGTFVQKTGWAFNNLTYAASARTLWRSNPLGGNAQVGGRISWTAADGRSWRTECDTALTGNHGCRSFASASVVEPRLSASGARSYHWVTKEIFNNMVRFTAPPPPGWIGKVDVGQGPDQNIYSWAWASADSVGYATDASGNFVVMSRGYDSPLRIDTFNPNNLARVGAARSISLQGWPSWGGVYAAPNGDFYVLVGRDNPAERSDIDVVAVRRYNASWQLLGTSYLKGGVGQALVGIHSPFDAAAPDMVLVGNRLIVHMSRLMFVTPDGLNHQSNLTFEVDTTTMKARTFDEVYGGSGTPYVSHSFNNFVTPVGNQMVFVDHGDAYPRSIVISVVDEAGTGVTRTDLMSFNGETGDNSTGATLTGLVNSGSDVLVVGTSIKHANAPTGVFHRDHMRNAFAITANATTGANRTVWLTNVSPTGQDVVSEPRVTQLSENRFAVMFTITAGTTTTTQYRLMDASANVLAQTSFTGLPFPSGAAPIKIGSRLMWLTSGESPVDVFALDISDPARPTLAKR